MYLPVNPPPLWFEFSVFLFPTSDKILMLDAYMYRCMLGPLKQIFPFFLLELDHLVLLISGVLAIPQMTITCVRSSPPTIPLMNLCFSARAATQATSSGQLLRFIWFIMEQIWSIKMKPCLILDLSKNSTKHWRKKQNKNKAHLLRHWTKTAASTPDLVISRSASAASKIMIFVSIDMILHFWLP